MITQMEVDPNDPAFHAPEKPIGAYYTKEQAEALMRENQGSVYKEDAGRGWRKVVPSPKPVDIVEKDSILNLLDNEFIVIACGGGGVPVIKRAEGVYEGTDAVIDKDFASAKLADLIDAEYLFILTAVDKVSINWGKPNEQKLDAMTVQEALAFCEAGHFAKGSMLPKVLAAVEFAKAKPGRKAVIASLEQAPLAIQGKSGTQISL